MLIFTTHKYLFFTRKEIWFYDGEPVSEGTYNTFSAAKKNTGGHAKFGEKYLTSVVDLKKTEDELFKAIHPTYRYDIRSAEKKNMSFITILKPDKRNCEDLFKSYNSFAKAKGVPALKAKSILVLRETGNVCMTKILLNDVEISTHTYLYDKKTVSLASSFHNIHFTDDKIRSEANKYLHWKDILLFKSMGFEEYDFGGLNQKKFPGITKFKESFGGTTVENYRFIKTSSIVFYLVSIFKKTRNIGIK